MKIKALSATNGQNKPNPVFTQPALNVSNLMDLYDSFQNSENIPILYNYEQENQVGVVTSLTITFGSSDIVELIAKGALTKYVGPVAGMYLAPGYRVHSIKESRDGLILSDLELTSFGLINDPCDPLLTPIQSMDDTFLLI